MPHNDEVLLERMMTTKINVSYPTIPPTEDEFQQIARQVRSVAPVSDEEFDRVVKRVQTALQVTMDVGIFISRPDPDHQSWLPSQRPNMDFFYWNRYRKYLEDDKSWNVRMTANMETVSSDILDFLGDPKNPSPWARRGMILGEVQSGKTGAYTGLCNMAADAGYKVIIVLSGMLETLRQQTQSRLDSDFAGRQSKSLLQGPALSKNVFDGVGKIDHARRIMAFTTVLYDFNQTVLNSNDLTLKNVTEPALFVVKKNRSILRNLESWLISNNADPAGKIDLPLLVIDDEADNASVNTRKDDQDPTAINAAIRSIMHRFYRSSYVGVTATPFANIFIHPETTDAMMGDDLFPRDFIYLLSPPTHYVGSEALFGDNPTHDSAVMPITTAETHNYFPFGHKSTLQINELPESLTEALAYFLLTNAIRDVRSALNDHRSMLVNVSRFTAVQDQLSVRINEWINQVRTAVRSYAGLGESQALTIRDLNYLKTVWDRHSLSAKADIPWETLQRRYLRTAIDPVEVRTVNQRSGRRGLDYSTHQENGFRVIAVGGNSLSRGLTLEGLCVSYFHRNSQMYDTLLQMGRWFGYQTGYEDLFKVWIVEDAVDWYGSITNATNELKEEIRRMNRLQLTPRDFGLKVRQDPSSLLVTARNKMRTATPVTLPVAVSGHLLETPRLKSDPAVLEANERVLRRFVSTLDRSDHVTRFNGHLWSDIDKERVGELLRTFETHPWHLAFQGAALAKYIGRDRDLALWDVYLANGSSHAQYRFMDRRGESIVVHPERRKIKAVADMLMISGTKLRVGAGGIARAGLSDSEILAAERAFKDGKPEGKNVPDSEFLMPGRKPLLMLHVLESEPISGGESEHPIPTNLFAIGVGLPRDDRPDRTAQYMVNIVELKRGGMDWDDPAVDDADEEDDDENV